MSTVTYSVSIDPDEEGYVGRECPECEKYFKVVPGTGIVGEGDIPCTCPYCGIQAPSDSFWTQAQIEYARSVAVSQFVGEFTKSLKRLERKPDPRAFLSIGIKVEGKPVPLAYYREVDLEQRLTCDDCTLQYAIYGVFGYCPDCGSHNSLQILLNNLRLVEQVLALSETADVVIGQKLVENSLSDCVAAFDGFGREITSVNSDRATKPKQATSLSFQNIAAVTEKVEALFGVNMRESLSDSEWEQANRCFQKRHVLAHRMGVADQTYVERSGDDPSLVGRKVSISAAEVKQLASMLAKIASHLVTSFRPIAT